MFLMISLKKISYMMILTSCLKHSLTMKKQILRISVKPKKLKNIQKQTIKLKYKLSRRLGKLLSSKKIQRKKSKCKQLTQRRRLPTSKSQLVPKMLTPNTIRRRKIKKKKIKKLISIFLANQFKDTLKLYSDIFMVMMSLQMQNLPLNFYR